MNLSYISKSAFLWLLASALMLTSCKDENNHHEEAEKTLKINRFVSEHMQVFYLWNEDMPEIDYRNESDSYSYFEKLLKKPEDRWSLITDDIAALEAYFKGVSKSPGYSIMGYPVAANSDQLVFFVEFVYPNSPASKAGLQRGDMFYKINGEIISLSNYQRLLTLDDKTITLGQYNPDESFTALSPTLEISAEVNMAQHPIVASNIIDLGDKKVAYLAYTSFISDYDEELSALFQDFKAQGVNEMVLDLRYNSGGSVSSAIKLGSMLAPATAHNKTFIYERFNQILRYENAVLPFNIDEPTNLNLDRLYVLTTENTASASEMIIYGLDPYLEIIQIGAETHGKYYASITIADNQDPEKRTHNWAIQPIVFKSENATNSIDYSSGLAPDYRMTDNWYNADLGDPNENFLSAALEHISTGGISLGKLRAAELKSGALDVQAIRPFSNPFQGIMYIDALPSR